MTSRKVYTKYRDIIEELGLKQLDVYRVIKDGRVTDVIRIQDPMTGKTLLFDLNAPREALSPAEFLERVKEELDRAGIEVSERRLRLLEEKLKSGSEGE